LQLAFVLISPSFGRQTREKETIMISSLSANRRTKSLSTYPENRIAGGLSYYGERKGVVVDLRRVEFDSTVKEGKYAWVKGDRRSH
jgi:hypothetical protein